MADGIGEVAARYALATFHALDTLTDVVVVLDDAGTVLYANPHALRLLDQTEEATTGTSIVDHVHPEDLARAAVTLARMDEGSLGVPVTPAFYRLRRRDGSWIRVELNATSVDGAALGRPGTGYLVVFGRYSGDHDLQDRLLGLLTTDAPAEEAFALVPEFGLWRHEGIDYAVHYRDTDGQARVAGSELLRGLGGLDDPGTPWATASTGEEVLAAVDDLHPAFGERATEAGVTHVWARPVPDPLHDDHAVVAFARTDGGAAAEVHDYALDIMATALGLVVTWRHQVEQLRRAAARDPLTGAANRSGFWSVLDRIGDAPTDDLLSVLYVDLDGFKAVNDDHGHAVGDLVLCRVAERLAAVVRPGDLVARLGGDEFAVVAAGVGGEEVATRIAERIVAALREPIEVGGLVLHLGASVGIATARADDFDPDALLEAADLALYAAKDGGRGRWHLAT